MGSNVNARIKHKRDTSANWTSSNPVLLDGEIIIVDTDNGVRTKTGDGTKRYSQLPFDDEVVRNLISAKLSVAQGVSNSGKILSIGTDGNIKTRVIRGDGGVSASISSADDSVLINHDNSGVSANTYGPASDSVLSFGDTYSVPVFTVDSAGHMTSADTHILTIPNYNATTSKAGLMSASDKSKIDSIETGATKVAVDDTLSETSENPVQNKVLNNAISNINVLIGGSSVPSQIRSAVDGLATETYVDNKVAGIVNSAPETLDTLNELATALGNDPNFATTVATQIGTKVDKVSGKGLSTNDYTTTEKNKLSGIASGAEVNQNAFSNVAVGTTTIAADGKTDTLTIAAGSNITLTPDATNDKITIAATDTVYTHPSYTKRTGVPTANATPAFGGTFKVSQPVSDATGHITAINSRTITIPSSTATTSKAGLMSASDKTTLSAIRDYVVEFGSETTGNWIYRKWNSGWLECWRTLSISGYSCNTAVGNWYRTAVLTPAVYPFSFEYDPYLQMFFETDTGTGGFVWPAGSDSDDNPVIRPHKFYIIRMTSANSISGKIHFYASGYIAGTGSA